MISVLLVDDHEIVIEGLRKLLSVAGDIDVTGEAHDAATALEQARKLNPDVILLDLRMPGATGIQAARRLRQQEYEGAIIVLTSYGDKAYVRQALEAGADSYLLKNTPSAELIESIRSADRGPRPNTPDLLDSVLEEYGGHAREKTVRDADLSDEDLKMLTLASEGATNREIGVSLNRSEIAVKKRLQTVFQKLDVNDRAHAVAEALRRGLI